MSIRLVAFDLDGTLTEGNSWRELTRDLGASLEVLDQNYLDILARRITVEQAKQNVIDLWRATGNASRDNIFRIFASWDNRPEARAVITDLKQRGIRTIILSGTFHEYAEMVAAQLGIDKPLTSAAMKFDRSGIFSDFDYEMAQGERKRKQLIQELEEQGLSVDECLVVGDSENDIEVFEYTKRGIAIGDAHPRLLELALKYIDNLEPLPQLIDKGL